MSYINQALHFLITLCFGGISLIVMLRVLLEHASPSLYLNPLFQLVCQVTNPVLRPFSGLPLSRLWRVIVILLFIVLCIQIVKAIISSIFGMVGLPGTSPGLLVLGVASTIQLALQIYQVCLFIFIILSWLQPTASPAISPIRQVLVCLLHWILSPLRRALPVMNGLDLSPLVAFVLLYLGQILLYMPLRDLAYVI